MEANIDVLLTEAFEHNPLRVKIFEVAAEVYGKQNQILVYVNQ